MIQYLDIPKTADAECQNCHTIHAGLPVEADEDGAYVAIEDEPCHHDTCTTRLCSCCPQFTCESCGLKFCLLPDHIGRELELDCTCWMRREGISDAPCPQHSPHTWPPPPHVLVCVVCDQEMTKQEEEARLIEWQRENG